jgi:hypothetical protein
MKRNWRRLLNVLKNNYTVFIVTFLFVILSQTGNFLWGQTNPQQDSLKVTTDSSQVKKKKTPKVRQATIPWKAALMSGIVPGLGQIYNRKYWKLPIVWGALGTTGYFIVDQHIKYIGFRDAYRTWVNDTLIVPGYEQYQYNPTGMKTERDNFERTRNILTIVAVALWTLNIVDAAVDAHLSTFDISPNLSMKIQPATFFNTWQPSPAVGVTVTFGLK